MERHIMSLTLHIQPVTDEKLFLLLKKPVLIWNVITHDNTLICDTVKIRGHMVGSFIEQLFKTAGISGLLRKNSDTEDNVSVVSDNEEYELCNLETAWHAIHYMLTDSVYDGDFPMNFLLSGGDEIGSIDVGFGPARAIYSNKVKEIHSYLSCLPAEVFMASYDAENLTKDKIYPEIWYRFYADDENRAYIREKYESMRCTVEKAAQHDRGLLVWISNRNLCTLTTTAYAA
jgi:hypothetical protein